MTFWKNYVAKPASYAALGLGVIGSGKVIWDYAAPIPVLKGVYSSIQDSIAGKLSQGTLYKDPATGSVVETKRLNDSEARTIGGAIGGLAALVAAGAALGVAGAGILIAGNKIRERIK